MTIEDSVRPRCYFDVEIGGLPMGRIIFELYSDICPITCENFRSLCTGEKGLGKTSGKPLHYQGIVFHRVVRDFMVQSGDFTVGNGTGGESIYGGTFEDENLELKHDKPYLLSMANRGKDTNGSQFFITTQPAPHLDGVHVVFGQVVSGKEVVTQIEMLPVDRNSRPLQDAKVSKCGELVLLSKSKDKKKKKKKVKEEESASSSSSSSESSVASNESGSEDEKERKKIKKKTRKDKSAMKVEEETEDQTNYHPLVSVSKIDPSEIPEVPSNRFLYRGDGRPKDIRDRDPKRAHERDRGGRFEEEYRNRRDSRGDKSEKGKTKGMTKSGRAIKGRGVFRFRTPSRSRSRSRSATPPHWKQAARRTIKLSEFERLEAERKAKEEEIARREEARKKRHEDRQREQKEHFQRLRNEAEQHFQSSRPKEHHDGPGKQEGERQSKRPNPTKRSNTPAANTGEPLDLNALDYESMDLGEDDETNKGATSDGEIRGLHRNGQPLDQKKRFDRERGPERLRNKTNEEERSNQPEKRPSSQSRKNNASSKEKIRNEKREKDRRNAEKLAESDDDLEKEKERLKELEKLKQRMEQELAKEMKEKEKVTDVEKKREKDKDDRDKGRDREREKEKEYLKRKEDERKREEIKRREDMRRKEEERRRREKEIKESKDRRDRRRGSEDHGRDRSKRRRSRSKSNADRSRKRSRRHSSSSSSSSTSSSSSSDDDRRKRR